MKITLIIGIFLLSTSNLFSQQDVGNEQMLSFGCGYTGRQSLAVWSTASLLDSLDYEGIINKLKSKNRAEQFLSVLVCERLDKKGIIQLNKEQKDQILKLRNSDDLIPVCSGCTYRDEVSFKNLLNKKNRIRKDANSWLKSELRKQ